MEVANHDAANESALCDDVDNNHAGQMEMSMTAVQSSNYDTAARKPRCRISALRRAAPAAGLLIGFCCAALFQSTIQDSQTLGDVATQPPSKVIRLCQWRIGQAPSNNQVTGPNPGQIVVPTEPVPGGAPPAVNVGPWHGGQPMMAPWARCGVQCGPQNPCCEPGWNAQQPVPWQSLLQGEYVGPPRTPHVPDYLIRPGDQIEFLYRRKREMTFSPYQLNVGDQIRVESLTDEKINRDLVIQMDGYITLPPAFQVRTAGRTIEELTAEIDARYEQWYKVPAITVTPIDTERRLQDLLSAVDSRYGSGGLSQRTTVTPEGTVQLAGIGNVPVIGLTLDELGQEIEQRYAQVVLGIGVTPVLIQTAPRFVYVGGEVRNPNRYTLEAPTTAIMAIEMAGGWIYGANLSEIVVFRRGDDWRLIATKLDLTAALLGRRPCPSDEIWLRDSDIIYLPKTKHLLYTDCIDLFFTRGLYQVLPVRGSFSWSSRM